MTRKSRTGISGRTADQTKDAVLDYISANCWVTARDIADHLGSSVQNIYRYVQELEAEGEISKVQIREPRQDKQLFTGQPWEISWNTFNGGENHGIYKGGELDQKGFQIAIVNGLPTSDPEVTEADGKTFARIISQADAMRALLQAIVENASPANVPGEYYLHKLALEEAKQILEKINYQP